MTWKRQYQETLFREIIVDNFAGGGGALWKANHIVLREGKGMTRTWADFEWPEWIPLEVRKQIEQFWSDEWDRGPDEWLRDMEVQRAPKLGLRCKLPKAIGDEWVEGRFVHAWNNIGRMVHDDGTYSVVVFDCGGFFDRRPILPDESTVYGNDNRDFREIIRVYDAPHTLFYVDPPYIGREKYYAGNFTEQDHRDLAEKLNSIQGMAVVSYYEDPLLDEFYPNWRRERFQAARQVVNGDNNISEELLLMNFEDRQMKLF